MCDVPVAGYPDIDTAGRDFDGLAGLVKAKKVQVEGVILVAHDQDGNVTVVDTGDHAGRKGARWGAGVAGLFAPPCWPRWSWAQLVARWWASSPAISSRRGP